ncbi:MAG: UbiA family prenyltransferase [Deltaproteobacteria bacterium]|nr:UbiA family prenyltransferase [Deltaproteobacteria bacterium]
MGWLADLTSILRVHIIAIAVTACLAFGWTLTGILPWEVALVGGLDWLLINLLNRVTDLKEDLENRIRGSERLVGRDKVVLAIWLVILAGSFVLSHLVAPAITPWRVGVQLVGVAYSYRVVPTPAGLRRFKDLYFFKNFMSAMLFVTTVFVYPLVVVDWAFTGGATLGTWLALVLFFVPFEVTYEILYDMRDLDGDRLAGIPTYPVVHGVETSRKIVDALLVASGATLAVAMLAGLIGARELLMLAAPIVQFLWYRPRLSRGLTRADCIRVTWLGAALLVFWLVGTHLWIAAGLPANLHL